LLDKGEAQGTSPFFICVLERGFQGLYL
jgi:hypothetical protein